MSKPGPVIPPKYLKPFCKLFCKQLVEGQFKDGSWKVNLGEGDFSLSVDMVWLQGRILALTEKKVKIADIDDTPITIHFEQPQKDLDVGSYVQVLGQVVADERNGLPHVFASKIVNLTESSVAQQMWEPEVLELHNLLTNKIAFKI